MPEDKKKKQFNYRYFLQTRQYLVVTLALAGISLLLGILFLFPGVGKFQELRSEQAKETSALNTLVNKRQTLENVESTNLYSLKDRINTILPSNKPVLPLVREIERVSGETGVIISEFGVAPGEISTVSAEQKAQSSSTRPRLIQNKDYDGIQTELVLIGKIDSINAFLKGLNQITPLTQTTQLALKSANQKLASGSAEPVNNVFEASLTLTSYFFLGQPITAGQTLPSDVKFDPQIEAQISNFRFPVASDGQQLQIEDGGKENLFQ